MKIKINQILEDENGKLPLLEKNEEVSLKKICITAVLNPIKEDDFKTKMEKHGLWKRLLSSNEEIELTSEEITLLKECIHKCFVQLVLGQCVEMLEQKGGV